MCRDDAESRTPAKKSKQSNNNKNEKLFKRLSLFKRESPFLSWKKPITVSSEMDHQHGGEKQQQQQMIGGLFSTAIVTANDYFYSSSFRGMFKILLASLSFIGFPMILVFGGADFDDVAPTITVLKLSRILVNCWDGLLHINNFVLLVITLVVSVSCAHSLDRKQQCTSTTCSKGIQQQEERHDGYQQTMTMMRERSGNNDDNNIKRRNTFFSTSKCFCNKKRTLCTIGSFRITPNRVAAILIVLFSAGIGLFSILQVIYPSYLWNPFMWGTYRVYYPNELYQATSGLCLPSSKNGGANNVDFKNGRNHESLCLSNDKWDILSSGGLSNRNIDDVESVMKGINYIHNQSGGIIINVMSRDTIDAIQPLRQNIEALNLFIPSLSVVIFENDSVDGSRQAFQKWQQESRSGDTSYNVDLMECEGLVDCKIGVSHRYDSFEAKNYFLSSAIGKMAAFRQKMVDYVVKKPEYDDYTHMIVIDLDLGISLSPLGILHSLGKSIDRPISSSGRQAWPGSFGTLIPPYDFSAFRPVKTQNNKGVLSLHQKYCDLMPAGHRWRNICDAMGSMHLMQILEVDRAGDENHLQEVDSAFNGATIYPIKKIREKNPQYDVGEDGQRCEHIGFNLGFQTAMFMNPKWAMNVHPANPGGPSGWRAMKNVFGFLFATKLTFIFPLQILLPMIIYVYAIMVLGMELLYPLLIRIMVVAIVKTKSRKIIRRSALPLHTSKET